MTSTTVVRKEPFQTLDRPDDCLKWTKALQAKYENKGKVWEGAADFDQILGGYTACTDMPCAVFALELIQAYPEAKVILNERPVDDWYKSAIRRCWAKANLHYFRNDMERNAKQIYKEHGALVKGAAPPGRFLAFNPSQGWGPLCKFLGQPIPKEDFPHGNFAQEFHDRIEKALRPRYHRGFCKLGIYLTLAAIGTWIFMLR
ncbi:hypothetical protein ACLMJK_009536 [Lecanora helva]